VQTDHTATVFAFVLMDEFISYSMSDVQHADYKRKSMFFVGVLGV